MYVLPSLAHMSSRFLPALIGIHLRPSFWCDWSQLVMWYDYLGYTQLRRLTTQHRSVFAQAWHSLHELCDSVTTVLGIILADCILIIFACVLIKGLMECFPKIMAIQSWCLAHDCMYAHSIRNLRPSSFNWTTHPPLGNGWGATAATWTRLSDPSDERQAFE